MLDGLAYQAHFPDDPADDLSARTEVPRQLSSPALVEALAALETELRAILKATSSDSSFRSDQGGSM
jgi:hypothetical protein